MSVVKDFTVFHRAHTIALLALLLTGLALAPQLIDAASRPEQPTAAYEVADPLPEECGGVNPSDQPVPVCCVYGYVYHDGSPVTGASVHIESLYGVLDTTTTFGNASDEPYYQADLSADPLLVSPGAIITVTATYKGSTAVTVYEVAPDGQQADVVIPVSSLLGNGVDGDLTVNVGQTMYINSVRTTMISTAAAGQNVVAVASAAGFSADDEVLIVQMAGTGTGNYEFGTIAAVSVGELTLVDDLGQTFTVSGNSKAQVLRVPHYRNVTIRGTLAAHTWDGGTGGIVSFRANGTTTIHAGGRIDAIGRGYAGGSGGNEYPASYPDTGSTGGSYISDSPLNGPTGDDCGGCISPEGPSNGGGGRGGRGSRGTDGASGGGGGSYGSSGAAGETAPVLPWAPGGQPGSTYGSPDLPTLFPGSGGGGGGKGKDGYGAAGGNGGGIVAIYADTLIVSGTINANGSDGSSDKSGNGGGGGGGSGGSIYLNVTSATLGTGKITATGGNGSAGNSVGNGSAGGGGGGGRISVTYCDTFSGSTNPLATLQQRDCERGPIVTIHTIYPRPAVQGRDTITFRGSAVDNDEGGGSITQYVWRSDLDGVLSTQAAFTLTASSLSGGTHTIFFKAKDDEGQWSEETFTTITVNPLQGVSPTASFSVSPAAGYTHTVFSFDASGSSDVEDPVTALKVRWDWQGDDTYDTGWSSTKTITHTYPNTGSYTVRLQVQDTDGLNGSTTKTAVVKPPAKPTTWLFILYLDGDNDLHRWFRRAMTKMEAATANPDLAVVALLDGAGNGNTWRYHVQPGGHYTNGFDRWSMGELDMSDPQTLSDFITWARDNYPAEYTYLAIADHGRGTTGIAWDDTSGNQELITVAELRTALGDATSNGTQPLDVVHYDACLMAMIENAYQIKDYADYMVASENLGWSVFAYDRYAAHVTAGTTPEALVAAIVDEYDNAVREYPRTISALDLGKTESVADAVTALATALQPDLDTNKNYVTEARDATQKFDSRDYFVINNNDEYLDLYDLAWKLQQKVPDSSVQGTAQGVMDAVAAFTVAERHASGKFRNHAPWDLDGSHGVAIYFPLTSGGWDYNNYLNHVFRFTAEGQWDEFLLAYHSLLGLAPMPPTDPGVPPVLNDPFLIYLPVLTR